MKFKKIIDVILCVLLCCICLFTYACSNSINKRWENYDESNFINDNTTLKVVNNKITIKMFAPKSSMQGDWNDMVLWKKMEEVTNVHIDWETVPLTSYTEKRGLKWLDTKNPVDGFFLSNTMSEVVAAVSNNKMAEIDELVNNYAPHYLALMEKHPEIEKVSSCNGHKYVFCSVNETYGDFAMQYINKNWLDKIGAEVPKTIDELYDVLKAFKKYDVNNNGNKNDEIPLSYIDGDATVNFISSAFGLVGVGGHLNVQKDVIEYGALSDNYRAYVQFMNKLYNEGLLDSAVFSNKNSDLVQKGQNNTLGCFSSAASYLIVGTENEENYIPVGPLTSAYSNKKEWYQYSSTITPNILVINNDTPYKKEITKWIDALYSEEAATWQNSGVEGINWEWDNDDKTSWTMKTPSGMDEETYRTTLTYAAGLGSPVYKTDFSLKGNSTLQKKLRIERENYIDYLREAMPQLTYTVKQSNKMSDIAGQIDSYLSNMFASFIKGIKNPSSNSDWNSFLQTMNKIGVNDLVSIYNEAYINYKK